MINRKRDFLTFELKFCAGPVLETRTIHFEWAEMKEKDIPSLGFIFQYDYLKDPFVFQLEEIKKALAAKYGVDEHAFHVKKLKNCQVAVTIPLSEIPTKTIAMESKEACPKYCIDEIFRNIQDPLAELISALDPVWKSEVKEILQAKHGTVDELMKKLQNDEARDCRLELLKAVMREFVMLSRTFFSAANKDNLVVFQYLQDARNIFEKAGALVKQKKNYFRMAESSFDFFSGNNMYEKMMELFLSLNNYCDSKLARLGIITKRFG